MEDNNPQVSENPPHQATSEKETSQIETRKSSISPILIGLVVLLVIAGAVFAYTSYQPQKDEMYPQDAQMPQKTMDGLGQPGDEMQVESSSFELLTEPKLIFTGGYADPTIVKKTDGSLIMYLNNFSQQPAKYEAHISADGISWTLASGNFPNASTGRAVVFGDQTRLYYPDRTPIRETDPPASILSALSSDGFNFTNESGTRVDPREGYYLEGPTVFQIADGSYRMYFSENDSASAEKRISSIWGASSTDGLTWKRDDVLTIEATVQDEHIPADWPQALHPFVLQRPDGSYLMLYNTHSELFSATSSDGISWIKTGSLGIHGADVDGYYVDNDTIRLYYGDFTPETLGVVYVVDVREVQ